MAVVTRVIASGEASYLAPGAANLLGTVTLKLAEGNLSSVPLTLT
jgi:hypothetical protein